MPITANWKCEFREGEPLTDFTNAYNPGYLEELRLIETGQKWPELGRVCPFDPRALAAEGREILCEEGGWFVIECRPHYRDRHGEGVPHHFLFVSKKHGLWVPHHEDMRDIGFLMEWVEARLPDRPWALAGRLGEQSRFAGQTILHNHLHYLSANEVDDPARGGWRSMPVDFGFF